MDRKMMIKRAASKAKASLEREDRENPFTKECSCTGLTWCKKHLLEHYSVEALNARCGIVVQG